MVPTSSRLMRVVLRRSHSGGFSNSLRLHTGDPIFVPPMMPKNNEGRGNTKTGVRSYHNPHHQGKGESTKHLAAHQEQNEHGEKGQSTGQDSSRKSLIDRFVNEFRELFFAQQTTVFANTIENDDRVIHRITDQS